MSLGSRLVAFPERCFVPMRRSPVLSGDRSSCLENTLEAVRMAGLVVEESA